MFYKLIFLSRESVVCELTDDKASEYDFCMTFKSVQSTSDSVNSTLSESAKIIVQKLIDNE